MNKILIFSLQCMLFAGLATAMTSSYDVTVEEGGRALAVLVLTGEGTVNVPMPLDAGSPVVEGGVYLQAENGIDMVLTGSASVVYKTDLLTLGENGLWTLDLELPDAQSSSVTLSLPANAEVVSTSPRAAITQTADSRNLIWTLGGEDRVSVQYRLTADGAGSQPGVSQPSGGMDYTLIILILAVVVLALLFVLVKKKARH